MCMCGCCCHQLSSPHTIPLKLDPISSRKEGVTPQDGIGKRESSSVRVTKSTKLRKLTKYPSRGVRMCVHAWWSTWEIY